MSEEKGNEAGEQSKKSKPSESSDDFGEFFKQIPGAKDTLVKILGGISSTAEKFAAKASEVHVKVEKAFAESELQIKTMAEAGEYLKSLREEAGISIGQVSEALNQSDDDLVRDIENGKKPLTFEQILRLASVLAVKDPISFIVRMTRAYKPDIWASLENWGISKMPIHMQREHQFINIIRKNKLVRDMDQASFESVLAFTKSAFDMAVNFVENQNKQSETEQTEE